MNNLKRKFRMARNHLLRIKSTSEKLREPEEIIIARDSIHRLLVDSERTSNEKGVLKYRSQLEVLKWILKENDNT